MSLIVSPLSLDIATNTEKSVYIAGDNLLIAPARNGFDASMFTYPSNYQIDYNLKLIRKTNNVIVGDEHTVLSNFRIKKGQAFSIFIQTNSAENPTWGLQFGVLKDTTGKKCVWAMSKSGGSPTNFALGVLIDDVFVTPAYGSANLSSDTWEITSDGAICAFKRNGQIIYNASLGDDYNNLQVFFGITYANNTLYNVNIFTAEIAEAVNTRNVVLVFSPSLNASLRFISDNLLGITPLETHDATLFVNSPSTNESTPVQIKVAGLFLRPVFELEGVVQEGDFVQFTSNAVGGILTASGGTVVDSAELIWQAVETGDVTLTYTVGANIATYHITVLHRIQITGVDDGFTMPLTQGEQLQLLPNIGGGFQCFNYPDAITGNGLITAPRSEGDAVFGKKTLNCQFNTYGLHLKFTVEVLPMYPSPNVSNGVISKHWFQDKRDYLPVIGKTTGGKKEGRNQNENGVIPWQIEYEELNSSTCPCSDANCLHEFDASRLDAFYNLVTYTDYFSLIDYHTGETFKYVTIDDYVVNHNDDFATEQTRSVKLYYDGGEIQF